MEEEEIKGLIEGVNTAVKAASTKVADAVKELEAIKADGAGLVSRQDELEKALKAQSDLVKSLKVTQAPNTGPQEEVMKALMSEDFKTALKNKKDFEFNLKFTLGNFSPNLISQQVLPGIGATAIPEYALTALLSKGSISARTLYYIDEVAYDWTDKTINVIPEGGLKPGVTTSFEEKNVSLIKFANSARVSYEALADVQYVSSVINNTLLRDLQRQVEASFIIGSGNVNFKGLSGFAEAYDETDLDGTIIIPSTIDGMLESILAVVLQMRLWGFNPDTVIVSPEVHTRLQIARDTNGNFIGQQTLAMLSGLNLVTTPRFSHSTADMVAADVFYVLDSQRNNAYNDGNIVVRAGYNADDFLTNRQSFVAEQRWLDFMYSRDKGAVVKETFTNMVGILKV